MPGARPPSPAAGGWEHPEHPEQDSLGSCCFPAPAERSTSPPGRTERRSAPPGQNTACIPSPKGEKEQEEHPDPRLRDVQQAQQSRALPERVRAASSHQHEAPQPFGPRQAQQRTRPEHLNAELSPPVLPQGSLTVPQAGSLLPSSTRLGQNSTPRRCFQPRPRFHTRFCPQQAPQSRTDTTPPGRGPADATRARAQKSQ